MISVISGTGVRINWEIATRFDSSYATSILTEFEPSTSRLRSTRSPRVDRPSSPFEPLAGPIATFPSSSSFRETAEQEFRTNITPTDDQFVIRAGTMSTDVSIRIRDDGFGEPTESLTVSIVSSGHRGDPDHLHERNSQVQATIEIS